jgi:glycosyltransferase involved in cell wall biosynthesis
VLLRALVGLEGVSAVLVGDGPEREPLEALAAELGLAERLVITGWRSDARAYLGAVDVFCLPSRYEGFPLAILEAMLGGLPVVATRVGSVAEAVLEGETGLLVAEDPEALREALRRALDPETGRRLGEAGRRRALERFSVEAMAHGYESLYDEAVLRR